MARRKVPSNSRDKMVSNRRGKERVSLQTHFVERSQLL